MTASFNNRYVFTWYGWLGLSLAVSIILGLYSLSRLDRTGQTTILHEIQLRGELVIVTRNAPSTYYEKHTGQFAGIEYDLTNAFAKYLGVKPRYILKDSIDEILGALSRGEADMAAAGLTITELREQQFIFGPTYQNVHQQVICHRKNKAIPRSMEDFKQQKLHVAASTSYAERLMELQKDYPSVKWQQNTDWDTEYLLQMVEERKLDCTVADSNIFAINRRYYPQLQPAFNLTDENPLAWVMRKNAAPLQTKMNDWFKTFQEEGKLNIILDRYYGHLDKFDYVDTQKFIKRIKTRLPKYQKWFKQAAKKYKLDWQLLAAQSYQESHWNRRAKSPTGVRGIMMLTQPTAKQLGIKNRLDPQPNIFAGARYLAQLRKRLPKEIKEPERTWMALAAYNMGYGHLTDAMELAKQFEKNPLHWVDLEQILPLLSQRRYYRKLIHGYARGYEAVHYVKQIRDYRDILSKTPTKKKSDKRKR